MVLRNISFLNDAVIPKYNFFLNWQSISLTKSVFFALFSDVRVHCENGDLDYKKQDHLFARMVIHLGCHDKF